eukprot:12930858-Alexandrium_andersonii.AAC.1
MGNSGTRIGSGAARATFRTTRGDPGFAKFKVESQAAESLAQLAPARPAAVRPLAASAGGPPLS